MTEKAQDRSGLVQRLMGFGPALPFRHPAPRARPES